MVVVVVLCSESKGGEGAEGCGAWLQPKWTLDVVLPLGASLTQLVNVVRGNRTGTEGTGSDGTQTIPLIANHVDQTLEADATNSVAFGTRVNATSQVSEYEAPEIQVCTLGVAASKIYAVA